MRSIPFLVLIFLATTSINAPFDSHAPIHATPVAFDPGDPAHVRLGPLRFLGGWRLTSPRSDFGGISALHIAQGRFLALADTGRLFRFRMRPGGSIFDTSFIALPAGPGRKDQKSDRDTESLVVDEESGRLWVGYERHNAVWRYDGALTLAEEHAEPAAMKDWPWNGGPEAMARLADGRFIIICEEPTRPGDAHEALLFSADPTRRGTRVTRFLYRGPPGFWVTDAAPLPDGRLLILHRDYSLMGGVKAALATIDPAAIRAGVVLEGRELARLQAPLTLDNMEALAIEREAGRTILWLASDDNLSPFQRTLLMKFELLKGR